MAAQSIGCFTVPPSSKAGVIAKATQTRPVSAKYASELFISGPLTSQSSMPSAAAHAIEEHIPRLRRYARALAGNAHSADDLVQDTLERAWQKFSQWRP